MLDKKIAVESTVEQTAFPYVIQPEDINMSLENWVMDKREDLIQKKEKYGALLLRGFDINTVEKFQAFIKLFVDTPIEYKLRSSPRYSVGKNVYHTTTYPKEHSINMHSESSYAPEHPSHIVFCCINPADERGETPIADNRLVFQYLSEETKKKFIEKGIIYIRNLNSSFGLSWEEVFQTSDPKMVEEICKEKGMEFIWRDEEDLTLKWQKKAIWNHPSTNETVWFNHGFFFNKYTLDKAFLDLIEDDDELPNNTLFGDGTEISEEEINEIRAAYKKATTEFPWEKGDVLFLDNMLASHGRNPYEGDRKIIASLF